MIKVTFKNVGQGDSIFLEWENNTKPRYIIIDCNTHEQTNPILDEIRSKNIQEIELLILSHLHNDHYAGFGEVLDYCIQNKIRVNKFYHTFSSDYLYLLDRMESMTQKEQRDLDYFFSKFEEGIDSKIVTDVGSISYDLQPINLNDKIILEFLWPNENEKLKFSRLRTNEIKEITKTNPDLNRLATIIKLSNGKECALLTSDSVIKPFKIITGKIQEEAILVQVPHHGSLANLHQSFWSSLRRKNNCPAVFSVGDEPKDKLPKRDVVEFMDKQGYYIYSTNYVYGLPEYFGPISTTTPTPSTPYLNLVSRKISSSAPPPPVDRFNGEKTFNLF